MLSLLQRKMIYVLGGIHCDKKFYKRVIGLLEKFKPDLVCLEELTSDREFIKAADNFIRGKLGIDEFIRRVKFEKYWFSRKPYMELFSYLRKHKIRLHPIDHRLNQRIKLIKLEKAILSILKRGKTPPLFLKEKEERLSVLDRERAMVLNIVGGIRESRSKNTCVIVGVNHSTKIAESLALLGHRVRKLNLSNEDDVNRYLKKIYKYAIQKKIENLKIPPLVPIFVLVFERAGKVVNF